MCCSVCVSSSPVCCVSMHGVQVAKAPHRCTTAPERLHVPLHQSVAARYETPCARCRRMRRAKPGCITSPAAKGPPRTFISHRHRAEAESPSLDLINHHLLPFTSHHTLVPFASSYSAIVLSRLPCSLPTPAFRRVLQHPKDGRNANPTASEGQREYESGGVRHARCV